MNPVNGLTASGMQVPENLLWSEEKMSGMGAREVRKFPGY